jgi:hypothetical protein
MHSSESSSHVPRKAEKKAAASAIYYAPLLNSFVRRGLLIFEV